MNKKRILSLLMAILMVFSMVPSAFADAVLEELPEEPVNAVVETEDTNPVSNVVEENEPAIAAEEEQETPATADEPETEPTVDPDAEFSEQVELDTGDHLMASQASASIDGWEFKSVQDALDAVGTTDHDDDNDTDFTYGNEVTLLRSATVNPLTVAEGKTVVLNLNGYTLTSSGTVLTNNGTLTILGGDRNALKSTGAEVIAAKAGSVTTIEGSIFTAATNAITAEAGATVRVTGGTFTAGEEIFAGEGAFTVTDGLFSKNENGDVEYFYSDILSGCYNEMAH
ncbi:MAG: hypothetical protein IJK01_09480 [Clostridia bacterium]|nr:hypothetical protein [Clostridia bacterium]